MRREYNFLTLHEATGTLLGRGAKQAGMSLDDFARLLSGKVKTVEKGGRIHMLPSTDKGRWHNFFGSLLSGSARKKQAAADEVRGSVDQATKKAREAIRDLHGARRRGVIGIGDAAAHADGIDIVKSTGKQARAQVKQGEKMAAQAAEEYGSAANQAREIAAQLGTASKTPLPRSAVLAKSQLSDTLQKLKASLENPSTTPEEKRRLIAQARKLKAKFNLSNAQIEAEVANAGLPADIGIVLKSSNEKMVSAADAAKEAFDSGTLKADAITAYKDSPSWLGKLFGRGK